MTHAADDIDTIYARLQELRGGEAVDVEWWKIVPSRSVGLFDVECCPVSDKAKEVFAAKFWDDPVDSNIYPLLILHVDWVERLTANSAFAGLIFRERAAP